MRTIKSEGKVKVVEFAEADQMKRRIIPVEADEGSAELGAPYGLPFAMLLQKHGLDERMAGRIEQELHRAGLWTVAELQQNPRAVQGAVQAAYGVDVAILLNLVRRYGGN